MNIVVNGRFSARKTGVGRVIENIFLHLQHIDRKNKYYIYVNKEFRNFIKFDNPNFNLVSNGVSANSMILNHLWTLTGFIYNALIHKADLIILPGITLYPFKVAPTIYFQHDLIEYYIPNQKWYKLLFRRLTFPITLRLADKIVGVSRNTVNDIKKFFGIDEHKLIVIYNGVNTDLFRPIPKEEANHYIKEKYGINDNFILYTGTLTLPQKNLLRLVNAYNILLKKGISAKLVMIGERGKDSQLIFKKVDELELAKHIIFTGYISDEDLPYFYNTATVFCFPSIYEGCGMPVLEAMACGCPVVTSKTSSLPEVAGDAALLVDPMNEDHIADAIFKLFSNNNIREEYIKRGFEQVKKFSWKNTARDLLKVINSFEKNNK